MTGPKGEREADRHTKRLPSLVPAGRGQRRFPRSPRTRVSEVPVAPLALERLEPTVARAEWERLMTAVASARPVLAGRRIWLVNSTAVGGGVAELLRSLVPYALGAGFDAHWLVVGCPAPFFAVTKELHNQLHGHPRKRLDEQARAVYESTLSKHAATLSSVVRAGDVVILHDPQTAALTEPLRDAGAIVIWRSHVGTDSITPEVERAWNFLLPYLRDADAFVFSRRQFVPPALEGGRSHAIAPSIDPTVPKNVSMPMGAVQGILEHVGLAQPDGDTWRRARFVRRDGSESVVEHCAEVLRYGRAPRLGVDPFVLHLARWDRLKDPVGVLRGFAEHVLSDLDVHLVMAGPPPDAVADDPDAARMFGEVVRAWRALPPGRRSRIQLALLPNEDLEENAAIVNALQRASAVVVKKSLEEGFGLGVTEAMWKRRAIVASRVGGIQEQIQHARSGLLLDDPRNLEAFGAAVRELLVDHETARQLGIAAQRRVQERFLHGRHLADWLELAGALVLERGREPKARPVRANSDSGLLASSTP